MTLYTPANHPLRHIKPDDWMLRNLRATAENLVAIASASTVAQLQKETKK